MLDPAKVAAAVELTGASSTSSVIDLALDRLVAVERLRRDIVAYGHERPDENEIALSLLPIVFDLEDGDVDYDALYGRDG